MISTRLHGAIDFAVSALFGVLYCSSSLAPGARRVLGTASLFHSSYAVLTDYEAGMRPSLSMRQHLALDAAGGAGLCAAGLLIRDLTPKSRLFLVAAGLAELGVVAGSNAVPVSGPGFADLPVGYAPLDTLKPVAPDLFIVDSQLPGVMGKLMPVRMTVIRLPDGGLLLHSPTRFTPELRRELEELGPIRHLVAPNVAHWTFLEGWQDHLPEVKTWAAPGLRERRQVRKSGVRLDADLGDAAPPEWGGAVELVLVQGGMGFTEAALFHGPTRSLMLTDLVLNLEPPRLPRLMRPLCQYMRVVAPDGMPPPYLRAVVKLRRAQAAEGARQLLALQPERVVFAHGRWFERNGTAALRRSLRWLLE